MTHVLSLLVSKIGVSKIAIRFLSSITSRSLSVVVEVDTDGNGRRMEIHEPGVKFGINVCKTGAARKKADGDS